jgi:hypothetical protein
VAAAELFTFAGDALGLAGLVPAQAAIAAAAASVDMERTVTSILMVSSQIRQL